MGGFWRAEGGIRIFFRGKKAFIRYKFIDLQNKRNDKVVLSK